MEKIHISDDDRLVLAKFTVPSEPDLLPIYVLNIYAPADSPQTRTIFYNKLMDYIKSLDSYGDILERLILAGDFNFQYDLRLVNNAPNKRPAAFVVFTDTFFHDCNNNYSEHLSLETMPTFRRGKVIKTLDYIMVGRQLKDLYFDNGIEHVSSVWTDHALLSIKWDRFKGYIRKLTKAYCSNRASWRKQRLKDLQSSRNHLIRQSKGDQEILQKELPKIEKLIARLKHELAANATLKAG